MRSFEEPRIAKGTIAGLIGGLAGALAMNEFQAVTQGVQHAWRRSAHQPEKPQQQGQSEADDATMKTADRIATLVSNRHLTREQKKKAGPIVHYAFGALAGALYGALAELTPMVTKGKGTGYGAAIWLGGDEIAVPKLGLSASPSEFPISVHAKALASHLLYGANLDLVRRGVRAAL